MLGVLHVFLVNSWGIGPWMTWNDLNIQIGEFTTALRPEVIRSHVVVWSAHPRKNNITVKSCEMIIWFDVKPTLVSHYFDLFRTFIPLIFLWVPENSNEPFRARHNDNRRWACNDLQWTCWLMFRIFQQSRLKGYKFTWPYLPYII